VAAGFWFNIGGESSGRVHVDEDGTATVITSNPDIGGSRASMAMMAAEERWASPIERVRATIADTTAIGFPHSPAAAASPSPPAWPSSQAAQRVVRT
jgi:CO/xanthine dehydrogenase Mo-binding subunit